MALLQSSSSQVEVPCRCLIGRSSLADIVVESRRASNEHASIGWYANQWIVRDLASSNGTTVNGQLLGPRDRVVLNVGSILQFGGETETWRVVDVAAPPPCAALLGPQRYVWGQRSLLVLPDEASPDASVFFSEGKWHVDDGGGVTSPACGDIAALPSGYWRLLLPDDPDAGGVTVGYQLELNKIELLFRAGPDGVVLHIVHGSSQVRLPARACLQTLLVLARQRQRNDHPDGGWIASAKLAELRACSVEKINVDVHRLRKLFEEAGVHGAANIVERDDTKKLRIGVTRMRNVDA
jgi:FHA domain